MTTGTAALGYCFGTQKAAAEAMCLQWRMRVVPTEGCQAVIASPVDGSVPSATDGGSLTAWFKGGLGPTRVEGTWGAVLMGCEYEDFLPTQSKHDAMPVVVAAVLGVLLAAVVWRTLTRI